MNASTGDILLFRGDPSSKLDKLIMDVTHSVYSHAALCIKDPWWGDLPAGTYIIQSERTPVDAVEQGERRPGVSMMLLDDGVEGCKVDIRRISVKKNEAFKQQLAMVHARVHNIPYDTSYWHWAVAGMRAMGLRCFDIPRHEDTLWCSALVAYIYTELGWLPPTTNWSVMSPQDLAVCDNVVPPASLGPVEIFKQ